MNRKLCGLGATILSIGALMAVTSSPATAVAGDTIATFALTGGSLSVSVQPTAVLGGGASGATSVSGQLGQVVVTDGRGNKVTWSVFGTSTTFTDGAGTVSTGVTYNAGAITTTGTVTMPAAAATPLSVAPAKVAGPTALVGNNTASWNPTLTVALPSSSLAGTYTGTINTSIS